MDNLELYAWRSFADVVKNFWGNRRVENYKEFVEKKLKSLQNICANMSIKVYFYCSHIDKFQDNYSDMRDPIYQGQIFKRSLTGLNSEFSFSLTSCLTKAQEISLPYYLPIAGGRIIRFIPFPRVLVLCEMQSASSRIWTRVVLSISYDDNHYTTGTSTTIWEMSMENDSIRISEQ